ncbi:MAG: PA0069 family radical SAM protein [Betaproteobacteria bacterium]|nr:PA0069 family radical SAM protein [Betaproteobacteria bacterium]
MKLHDGRGGGPARGRGATCNPEGRFESVLRQPWDDGWARDPDDDAPRAVRTVVTHETARGILSRNDSPDVPFSQSVNPYRGCEHGCIYCYARPSHAYLGLSPGLDFETRLFAKVNAASLLRETLAKPGYRCEPIALGANTDPYQPVERPLGITREVLEVLAACRHPFTIVTKNAGVLRDIDLLAPLAAEGLCRVHVSVTTLDHGLARRLEPRASSPARRIEAIGALTEAGVPAGVLVAPVIPFLTDDGVEHVLEAAAAAGAVTAGFVLLRLPHEIGDLFRAWLDHHYPLKAAHVVQRLAAMRGGRENDPRFGSRMTGEGELARLLAARFGNARRRLGLAGAVPPLDCSRFRPPSSGGQLDLF